MIATLELEITATDRASILREWLGKPFHNALNVERVPASTEGDRRVIAGPFAVRARPFQKHCGRYRKLPHF
jgi:hypothetical protein